MLQPKVLDILIRVIQHRVIVGADVGEGGIDALGLSRDGAGELGGGVFRALHTLRVDEIRHGLGSAQLQAAVQEGPFRKFPRLGLARAEAKALLQHGAQQGGRAVALKLGGVLPGIALRPVAERAHTEIQQGPVPGVEPAVDKLPVLIRPHPLSGGGAKERLRDRMGLGARQAHDADGGDLRPGCGGGDGIRHPLLPPVSRSAPRALPGP